MRALWRPTVEYAWNNSIKKSHFGDLLGKPQPETPLWGILDTMDNMDTMDTADTMPPWGPFMARVSGFRV